MSPLVTAASALILASMAIGATAAPPEKRDFFGTVVSVGENLLKIATDDGFIVTPVSEETVIRLPLKRDAALTDLIEGDVVAVSLSDYLVAEKIFVIPRKTQFRHVAGEVTAVEDELIVVQPIDEGAEPISFKVGPDTKVRFRGGAIDVAEGVVVVVLTRRDPLTGDLSTDALEVHVIRGMPHVRRGEEPPAILKETPKLENVAKVHGVLKGIDHDGNWIINGTKVLLDVDAEIKTGIVVGQVVEVKGVLGADGSLFAHEIEAGENDGRVPNRTRLEGTFQGVDAEGNWTISGIKVVVDERTDTDGRPFEGQRVKVEALLQEDGSILAREIENKSNSRRHDGNTRPFKLKGAFQGIDAEGSWIVNGVKFSVDEFTELEGTPTVGSRIEIDAVLHNGKFLAREIEIEERHGVKPKSKVEVELNGVIELIEDDGSLVVAGHSVIMTNLTKTEGHLTPGAMVKIKALLLEDGSLVAREVENDGPDIDLPSRVKIEGTVERLIDDTTIVVNNIIVDIDPRSKIRGDIVEGVEVKVTGVLQADGSVLARSIEAAIHGKPKDVKTEIKGVIEEVITEDGRVVAIVVDDVRIELEDLTDVDVPLRQQIPVKVKAIVTTRGLLALEVDKDH